MAFRRHGVQFTRETFGLVCQIREQGIPVLQDAFNDVGFHGRDQVIRNVREKLAPAESAVFISEEADSSQIDGRRFVRNEAFLPFLFRNGLRIQAAVRVLPHEAACADAGQNDVGIRLYSLFKP